MTAPVQQAFARRVDPGLAVAEIAPEIAGVCQALASRFALGGRLIVFGNGGTATDAHHIVVEFLHPVLVGKRALPALALTTDAAALTGIACRDGFDETFAAQLRLLAEPGDIAFGLSADGRCVNVRRALTVAREMGLLSVAMVAGDGAADRLAGCADHVLAARTDDPHVAKEVFVTMYHILWELVHVLLDQPGGAR
jgi:D-sedoheptulose 7-phosphate isomerase